jgi:hypothetical protein
MGDEKKLSREDVLRERDRYESQFPGVLSTAAREGTVITMGGLLAFLAVLVVASAVAFGAGWHYRDREAKHLITVQEVTEIQDGMREEIGELQSWRVEFDNNLSALQACANAAGWGRVERESKIQNQKSKIEY